MTQAISDGHLYVNDGETFNDGLYTPEVPVEQKEQEQAEVAVTAASYPVMASVAEWFKQAIVEADDIHNIVVDSQTFNGVTYSRNVSIEAQVLAYQLYKEKMTEKFDEYKTFIPEEES